MGKKRTHDEASAQADGEDGGSAIQAPSPCISSSPEPEEVEEPAAAGVSAEAVHFSSKSDVIPAWMRKPVRIEESLTLPVSSLFSSLQCSLMCEVPFMRASESTSLKLASTTSSQCRRLYFHTPCRQWRSLSLTTQTCNWRHVSESLRRRVRALSDRQWQDPRLSHPDH
jgi:hypothetical protein